MNEKCILKIKTAAVCAQGLIMLLTSCASVVGPGTGSAPSDTPADPTESAVTTTVAPDAVSAIVTTDAESGAQTGQNKPRDPAARAAAIEAILSKLPEQSSGEAFELKANGTVLVSGTKYLTRTVGYEKTVISDGWYNKGEREATVTVAQNAADGSFWIVVRYSRDKDALAAAITPDEITFRKITDRSGLSQIEVFIFNESARTEDLSESLLFTGYQVKPFKTIVAEINDMLTALYSGFSLETFGVLDGLPAETVAPPAGADFLFGDERYRVELLKDDKGRLELLRLSSAAGGSVEFSLNIDLEYPFSRSNCSVDLFVFAYRDGDGGIRVVTLYEQFYKTDITGTLVYRPTYASYDCVDGSLTPALNDRPVDGTIVRHDNPDENFVDSTHVYRDCRELSLRALTEARAKATDGLIVFDYYSDRDESLNRYMTPGEIPESADWKIADTLDIR